VAGSRGSRVHPLQPFSPRNYRGAPRSYDGDWCAVAGAAAAAAFEAAGATGTARCRRPGPCAASASCNCCASRAIGAVFVNTRLQVPPAEAPAEMTVFSLDALQAS
jgi:hypothetical protein